jgi:glucose-6-phosphate dehydrogenase assembly protein OpcA
MALDTTLLGQPVELGQIPRELKKLWESSGGSKSRASLVNLVVYCEGTEALEANTQLISEFTRDHACRAILVANIAEQQEPRVKAWINAHCHLPRAGAKQVCCEQITFVIERGSEELLSNTLFAHLDSDLPLYLWWQGEFTPPFDESLLTWVDRLIFDSSNWKNPASAFELLTNLLSGFGTRVVPCDLDWTRSLHLRQAVAQVFDHPENLLQIPRINQLSLSHAPGNRSTALLMVAWIAAQLGWVPERRNRTEFALKNPDGNTIAVSLNEVTGAPISSCVLSTGDASVAVHREGSSMHHRAEVRLPDGRIYHHLLPAGSDDLVNLLDEELTRGGKHRVYLKALQTLRRILPA